MCAIGPEARAPRPLSPMTTVDVNPPRWVPDPAGRFAQRYWDGGAWTGFVAGEDGGAATLDPVGPPITLSGPRPGRPDPEPPDPSTAAPSAHPQADEPGPPGPDGDDGGQPPIAWSSAGDAAAVSVAAVAAGWQVDPAGRFAQRYWDGERWSQFVAGEDGGPAELDPAPVGTTAPEPVAAGAEPLAAADPAPAVAATAAAAAVGAVALEPAAPELTTFARLAATDAVSTRTPSPAATTGPVAAGAATAVAAPVAATAATAATAAGSGRRWWLVAAAVALVAAGGIVAALFAAGVLGGHAGSVAASHRPAARAARPSAGHHGGTATATTAPATAGVVVAGRDPCGLLTPSEIASVTGIPAGAGQPLPNGCAWHGPGPIGGPVSAVDKQVFGTKEGVLISIQPVTSALASVQCTGSIPGLPVAAGVCSGSGSEEGHYAMFRAAGNVVVEISVHTARPTSDTELAQLAQHAYQHTV